MKLLAIDSSGLVASAAIVEDDTLIAEYTVNYKKTHSQTLLPMIDELVQMTEQPLDGVDALAVAEGPGSFTGLRIGAATVKGLGLALQKPIIPVPTVDALAYNLYGCEKIICPIMDARRNQVYTGLYRFENGKMQVIHEQWIAVMEKLCEMLNELGLPVVFLGDGVSVYQNQIAEQLTVPYEFAPTHCNKQRAAAVAALALVLYRKGICQTAAEHEPVYLRLSQAERERREREEAVQNADS